MTSGLMRRVGAVVAISAAVLAFTVSTADATPLDGREAGRASATPAALPAGSFDGKWIMDQSNVSRVSLFLGTPDGAGHFTGFASVGGDSGDIDGTVHGDDVVFFIHWNFGHTGRYDGHHGPDDKWSGVTVDLDDPSSQATWVARRG
ncbi:hypothetical protein ACFWOX_36245 [Streptomyces sp. NPDC058467]|uniref:hypothetical protein n=1 Tax=Streptomyces sp. NPDC058467 TaxID=3346513 RepID=UPI003660A663